MSRIVNVTNFFKSSFLMGFIFCFYSCGNEGNNRNNARQAPKNLPVGTTYSSDAISETFTQNFASLAKFHKIGDLGCESIYASKEENDLCAAGKNPAAGPYSKFHDSHIPSLRVFHTQPRNFSNFPVAGTEHDTISLEDTYAWKNETTSGKFVYGPFINIESGGKLIANFSLYPSIKILETFPDKIPLKSVAIFPKKVMFTLQLVADGVVLTSKDFYLNRKSCFPVAYYPEKKFNTFLRYENENSVLSIVQIGQLNCNAGLGYSIETKVNGPLKNIEARIVLDDSPVNLVLSSTEIIHEF